MTTYVKRTQRDYSLAFKLAVVEQIEKGELTYKQAQYKYGIQGCSTVLTWLRKHGTLNWRQDNPSSQLRIMPMTESSELTPEQRIKILEQQLAEMTEKAMFFETFVHVMEDDFGLKITKKSLAAIEKKRQSQSR